MANRNKIKSCTTSCYREVVKEFQSDGALTGNDALNMTFLMADNKHLQSHHQLVAPSYFLVAVSKLSDSNGFKLTDQNINLLEKSILKLIDSRKFSSIVYEAEGIIQASLEKGTLITDSRKYVM